MKLTVLATIKALNQIVRLISWIKLNFCLQQRHWSEKQFIGANDSSLFMCVLSNQVIVFWTSPCVPGVACEDRNFFSTGRWGTSPTSPLWVPPLPREQAHSRSPTGFQNAVSIFTSKDPRLRGCWVDWKGQMTVGRCAQHLHSYLYLWYSRLCLGAVFLELAGFLQWRSLLFGKTGLLRWELLLCL